MSFKSLSERKRSFLEDCCGGGGMGGGDAGGPTMSMGDAGYQGGAPAEGPVAGYDPMLSKKKKITDTIRKLKRK